MLTAAVLDDFLMCHTHDAELVFRPAASSPTQASHPAGTLYDNTDKAETHHDLDRYGPVFPFFPQLYIYSYVLYVYLSGV